MEQTWQIDRAQTLDVGGPGEPVGTLAVVLVSGRIDIVAHADASAVRADVHEVQGRPLSASYAGGVLRLEHHKEQGGAFLDMVKGFLANSRTSSARLTVTVPVGTRVSVTTVGADVLVGGLDGEVSINTVSGAVSLSRLGGRVDVKTVSSAVDASGLRGELKSKSVSGRVTVDASALRSAKLATVSGPILLDLIGSAGLVTANGVSGDITVRIPRTVGYDVTAASQSGHVVVDGQTLSGGADADKGGHRSDGDRAFAMKLRCVSGNVVVLRDGDELDRVGGSGAGFLREAGSDDVQDTRPGAGGAGDGTVVAGDVVDGGTATGGPAGASTGSSAGSSAGSAGAPAGSAQWPGSQGAQ